MTKTDRIACSRERTSREAWIALKLGCTEQQAHKYILEVEAAL